MEEQALSPNKFAFVHETVQQQLMELNKNYPDAFSSHYNIVESSHAQLQARYFQYKKQEIENKNISNLTHGQEKPLLTIKDRQIEEQKQNISTQQQFNHKPAPISTIEPKKSTNREFMFKIIQKPQKSQNIFSISDPQIIKQKQINQLSNKHQPIIDNKLKKEDIDIFKDVNHKDEKQSSNKINNNQQIQNENSFNNIQKNKLSKQQQKILELQQMDLMLLKSGIDKDSIMRRNIKEQLTQLKIDAQLDRDIQQLEGQDKHQKNIQDRRNNRPRSISPFPHLNNRMNQIKRTQSLIRPASAITKYNPSPLLLNNKAIDSEKQFSQFHISRPLTQQQLLNQSIKFSPQQNNELENKSKIISNEKSPMIFKDSYNNNKYQYDQQDEKYVYEEKQNNLQKKDNKVNMNNFQNKDEQQIIRTNQKTLINDKKEFIQEQYKQQNDNNEYNNQESGTQLLHFLEDKIYNRRRNRGKAMKNTNKHKRNEQKIKKQGIDEIDDMMNQIENLQNILQNELIECKRKKQENEFKIFQMKSEEMNNYENEEFQDEIKDEQKN